MTEVVIVRPSPAVQKEKRDVIVILEGSPEGHKP